MIYLHVHSNHSLLEGTATIRQLVARAVEYGMNTLALTDTDGLYGAIPFYEAAKAAGVRPIVGVWLDPCVLLAKDREGYAQLCHVVTAVRLGEVKKEDLASWPFSFDDTHLFVMSGDRGVLRSLQKRGLAPLAAVEHRGGFAFAVSCGRPGSLGAGQGFAGGGGPSGVFSRGRALLHPPHACGDSEECHGGYPCAGRCGVSGCVFP